MRLLFFVAIILLFMPNAYTQDTSFVTSRYFQLAKAIDQDRTLKKIRLENEDFLDNALDGGGELTGYFHLGEVRKIHCWIGYSWGTDEKKFYFKTGTLVYVHHISRRFVFDEATDTFRHDSLEAPFTGQYFFRNGTLLHYVITESGHHFESEKEDIESSVKKESEEWLRVLKQHKNRTGR
jgi:hypothetical protein